VRYLAAADLEGADALALELALGDDLRKVAVRLLMPRTTHRVKSPMASAREVTCLSLATSVSSACAIGSSVLDVFDICTNSRLSPSSPKGS
jgi:hypothetical protein